VYVVGGGDLLKAGGFKKKKKEYRRFHLRGCAPTSDKKEKCSRVDVKGNGRGEQKNQLKGFTPKSARRVIKRGGKREALGRPDYV